MSSHREAPAISQDPVADNADTYAFVSPDDPTTVTIITNYVPLEGPPGGPNFFEFGDDVLYSIYIDNDGDALPDITYQFQFTRRSGTRTRSSTTPGRSARSTTRTGTSGSSTTSSVAPPGHPWAGRRTHEQDGKGKKLNKDPRVPALQHRPSLDAELRRPRQRGQASPAVRRVGVRRPAERRLLRRPRRDLRPRGHPGSRTSPDHDGGGNQRRLAEDAEHPHDRDPGADQHADAGRLRADRPDERGLRARHLGRREPAQGALITTTRTGRREAVRGCRSRASATRSSTRSSSRSGTRTAGTRSTRTTTMTSRSTSSSRSSRGS